jgi:hypothetical protein
MSQQINLFDPSLRPRHAFLTASRLALLLGGLVLLTLAYYAVLDQRAQREQEALSRADERLKQVQAKAAALGLTTSRTKSQEIEASIAKAEAELATRQALLDRLKGGDLGNPRGFSDFMAALARQRTEGIWITGLAVGEGGADFQIQGGVTRPELLTEYIRRLSREDVMKGKPIDDLRIERKELAVRDEKSPAQPTPQPPAPRPRFIEFSIAGGATRAGAGG